MSQRVPRIILEELLESLQVIHEYTEHLSADAFFAQRMVQDAVVRRLEILGEAANQLPTEWKDQHAEVPWQIITGMRNRLIHGYFSIDLSLVWGTITRDLPPLEQQLRQIAQQEPPEEA